MPETHDEAPHHLPLQEIAVRLRNCEDVGYTEIISALDEYLLAMASFSLIDVETWFQNILYQMAPICLCKPEVEEYVLNLLLGNWHQMGCDDLEKVMYSITYMRDRCSSEEYDRHKKDWLDCLLLRPELIRRCVFHHEVFRASSSDND